MGAYLITIIGVIICWEDFPIINSIINIFIAIKLNDTELEATQYLEN